MTKGQEIGDRKPLRARVVPAHPARRSVATSDHARPVGRYGKLEGGGGCAQGGRLQGREPREF